MITEDMSKDSDSPGKVGDVWQEKLEDALPPIPICPLAPGYRFGQFAGVGLWQGALAGCVSLVLNIMGSMLWPTIGGSGQHPLRLIQVYLTFPLGARALELQSGTLLALGCLMYLVAGMLYGMLFVVALSYFLPNAGVRGRLAACSVMAIAVWAVNFYGILSWLQPWLLGGQWITELIPWWVAALTHLAFGWTIALIYPLAGSLAMEQRN
jgi:hypothetical protein